MGNRDKEKWRENERTEGGAHLQLDFFWIFLFFSNKGFGYVVLNPVLRINRYPIPIPKLFILSQTHHKWGTYLSIPEPAGLIAIPWLGIKLLMY